tara:strand:- start:759 stop:1814 length:1056 start_codon:yes stop_codon:yes gene_type:complete
METDFQKGYKKAKLTFESDRITFQNEVSNWKFSPGTMEVMMDWEQPIMEKMAEIAVSEGDHVLECGFGMGILSDAIQARNPASHTICENHPDIIPKMREWAEGKSNVILHEDRWYTLIEQTGRYDAILMDTYADDDLHPKLRYFCRNKGVKTGCKVTWWNWSGGTTDEYMRFYWDDISFTDVAVDPPTNSYYNRTVYKVPLKILTPNPTSYGVLQGTKIHISSSETKNIEKIGADFDVLTCADPANPTLATNQNSICFNVKCRGVYTINDGLLVATGTQPMIIKRSGSWLSDKQMSELVVGDKLYKVDDTEVEITKIDFDTSDTIHVVSRIVIDHNHFANDILIRKEDTDG